MKVRTAGMADAQRVAEIHVASWQDAFRGIMPDDYLNAQSVQERQKDWERNIREYPDNLMVAEDSNGYIQGFVCNGYAKARVDIAQDFQGQIYGIHVHPSARRNGIGLLMMRAAFERLTFLGLSNAYLWTLEDNKKARNFYEKIGGQIVGRSVVNFGKDLVEIAYGWNSLTLP